MTSASKEPHSRHTMKREQDTEVELHLQLTLLLQITSKRSWPKETSRESSTYQPNSLTAVSMSTKPLAQLARLKLWNVRPKHKKPPMPGIVDKLCTTTPLEDHTTKPISRRRPNMPNSPTWSGNPPLEQDSAIMVNGLLLSIARPAPLHLIKVPTRLTLENNVVLKVSTSV